jgi:catechol 2,3-dioxygenase-like lactoylglutathione lyase family enzyme
MYGKTHWPSSGFWVASRLPEAGDSLIKHLDHLNITVRDFRESVDWYRRVFDFELVEEGLQDGSPWGVIRSGEAMLCIYEHRDIELLDRHTMRARGLHGLNHIGLRITDREKWLDRAEREGVEILYEGPVRWPHATAWYVKDPTGWEIEVAHWDDDHIAFDPMEVS